MTQQTLTDRTILITGAAGSLGRVAAMACAEEGAQVVLLDKAVERLEKIHDEIVALATGSRLSIRWICKARRKKTIWH
jgi:NAD(P)-dependent dehydrogenase (short-subunit alcohol dehydrogenase family)